MQVVNVHLCRTRRRSLVSERPLGNRVITTGIVVELVLILLIDYTHWGNAMFGTAPIPVAVWALVLPFAAAMLLLEDARKAIVRSRMRHAPLGTVRHA